MNSFFRKYLSDPGWIIVFLCLLVVLVWALLKATGMINTPMWVNMIPVIASAIGVFVFALQMAVNLGRILQKIDYVCSDVRVLRSEVDKVKVNCPRCKE